MKRIIESLLDTDNYKLSMQRIYFYRFSDVVGEYSFRCRGDETFTPDMVEEIRRQIDLLGDLRFTEEEIEYVKSMWYHSDAVGFHEFLRFFRLNPDFVTVDSSGPNGLTIRARGPLWAVSPFEIHVLSIVNEVYFTMKYDMASLISDSMSRFTEKMKKFRERPFSVTEFGTRRRLSVMNQDIILRGLMHGAKGFLAGTSNVHLARKYGIKAMGTFAHEYVCVPQGLNDCSLRNSQRYAWDQWCREYRGALGICLTDTLGQDKFEMDFDRYWANMFTGLRHDSGDPIEWGERAIDLYRKYDIDPGTKTLMFSDSLDFNGCWKLEDRFAGRVRTAYGIGTWLTNDTGKKPLNIVFKLVGVNGRPVAKLSNVDGKTMCEDDGFVKRLREDIRS